MPAPPGPLLPVLALDTSTETLAAGIHTGRDAFTASTPGGALASAAALPHLQGLLQQAGLVWADLRCIAYGSGPGAFTGLRTACAVAQGLGFGLALPLAPIDSLLIVAEDARCQAVYQAGSQDQPFEIGVAMDARMDEAYAGVYRWQDGHWQVLQAPALMTLAALSQAWADLWPQALAGSALRAFGSRLQLPAAMRFEQEQDRAAALTRLALAAASTGQTVDAAQALPLYLRDKVAFTSAERAAIKAGLQP